MNNTKNSGIPLFTVLTISTKRPLIAVGGGNKIQYVYSNETLCPRVPRTHDTLKWGIDGASETGIPVSLISIVYQVIVFLRLGKILNVAGTMV